MYPRMRLWWYSRGVSYRKTPRHFFAHVASPGDARRIDSGRRERRNEDVKQ
jgi:hypothetical protein